MALLFGKIAKKQLVKDEPFKKNLLNENKIYVRNSIQHASHLTAQVTQVNS